MAESKTSPEQQTQYSAKSLSSVKELLDKLGKKETGLNSDGKIDLDGNGITNQNDVLAFLSGDINLGTKASETEKKIAESKDIELDTIQKKINFLESLLSNVEETKDLKTIEKLKEITKVVKENIDNSNKKIEELKNKATVNKLNAEKLLNITSNNAETIVNKKVEIEKKEKEIETIKKEEPTNKVEIEKKEKEKKKITGDLKIIAENDEKVKKELNKTTNENKTITVKLQNEKIIVENNKTILDKTVDNAVKTLGNTNSKSLESKTIKAIVVASQTQSEIANTTEKQNDISILVAKTKNTMEVIKEVQKFNEAEMKKFLENMKKNSINLGSISKYYNKQSINFYKKNPENIIEITDKEKLKEVLSSKDCNTGNKEFIDFINDNFLNNLDILILFVKKSTIALDTKNIKSFSHKDIKNREIEFFKLLKPATLKNFLISNYYGQTIKNFGEKTTDKDSQLKKDLKKIGDIEKNNDILKYFRLEDFDKIETSDKLDNTLANLLDKNTDTVLKLFEGEKNINKLYQLPKLLYKIKNMGKDVTKIINIEPLFYDKFLSSAMQKEYSVDYINSLLSNGKNNSYSKIANVKFNNISQAILVFKKLKNSKVNFKELLEYPKIRNAIRDLLPENEEDMTKMTKTFKLENKKILGEMQRVIQEHYLQYQELKDSFRKSELNTTLNRNKTKKTLLNTIFNSNMFLNVLNKNGNNSGFIVGILRGKLEDLGKGESIENYYINLYDSLKGNNKNKKETFEKIIKDLNEVISSELMKKKDKIEKTKIEKKILDKIKNKNLINDGKIDLDGTENEFNKYLLKLEIELKKNGKKLDKNNLDLYLNNFIRINNLSELPNKFQKEIKEYIKLKNKFDFSKSFESDKDFIKAVREGTLKNFIEEERNNYFSNLENKIKEYDTNQIEKENQREKEEQDKRLKNTKYPYDRESGKVSITNENGKTNEIVLTNTEKLLVNSNPEILKNIVDFYIVLEKVGLSKIWSKKESLFKSIGNINGEAFSIDSDYLNENRIKIFLNSILKSVGEDEISPVFTLNSFISKIELQNKVQLGGGQAIVNNYYGETHLENLFFEKFIPRDGTIIDFNTAKFEKSLTEKSNK